MENKPSKYKDPPHLFRTEDGTVSEKDMREKQPLPPTIHTHPSERKTVPPEKK